MADNKKQWFVVHTYSGYENKVKMNLERRTETMNMEDYIFRVIVPMEDEVQVRDGERKVVKRKVYPGYVMVEMILTDDSWYVVRNTTGVTGFVGTGAKPVPLADDEVQMILRQMGYEDAAVHLDYSVGEKVRVTDGSFAGVTGTVLEINADKSRIKVQVDMLGSTASVDLDYLQLEKIDF
jgi:transcriptional antiterminator NusG